MTKLSIQEILRQAISDTNTFEDSYKGRGKYGLIRDEGEEKEVLREFTSSIRNIGVTPDNMVKLFRSKLDNEGFILLNESERNQIAQGIFGDSNDPQITALRKNIGCVSPEKVHACNHKGFMYLVGQACTNPEDKSKIAGIMKNITPETEKMIRSFYSIWGRDNVWSALNTIGTSVIKNLSVDANERPFRQTPFALQHADTIPESHNTHIGTTSHRILSIAIIARNALLRSTNIQ